MNAEQLFNSLERRGHAIQLHPRGGFTIVPPLVLTDDERTALKDTAAQLERLLRERSSASENPGDPAKATKPATKLSPADALLVREAQRRLPGSPLVGIGRQGRGSDRKQPDLTFAVIDRGQPPVDQPPPSSSSDQPTAPEPEPVEAVVETNVEPPPLTLKIDAPTPGPEAPAADPAYDSDVTDTSSPEPDEDPLERKEGIIWVTIAPVRNGRQKIRVNPSPIAVRRDRPVRLCVEEIALSGVDRFRLLQGPATLWREVRLVRVGTGLRLAIVL